MTITTTQLQADILALDARLKAVEAAPIRLTAADAVALVDAAFKSPAPLTSSGSPTGNATTPVPPSPLAPETVSMFEDGKITGAPFLTSGAGTIWKFAPSTAVAGKLGCDITLNGIPTGQSVVTLKLAPNGIVYFYLSTGYWCRFRDMDTPHSGLVVGAPPTTAGAAAEALPVAPTPANPAPGTGNTVLWGDNQTCKTLQAAHDAASPGDTLAAGDEMIGKTVAFTLLNTKAVKIDGRGRLQNGGTATPTWTPGVLIDGANAVMPHQMGGFVVAADIEIVGFDMTGFGAAETGAGGTAAIRPNAPCNIKVRHCKLWRNQDGVGPNIAVPHTIEVTDTLFLNNGLGDGQTHNIYVGNLFHAVLIAAVAAPVIFFHCVAYLARR